MATKVQQIINHCQSVVNDDLTKWPPEDWLSFVNLGQLLIAQIDNSATATTVALQLVAGVYQACPAGAIKFLGLTNNLGANGTTPGAAIPLCDSEVLSAFNPSWMAATPATSIENYMYDENEPTKFRVSPPVHGSTAVHVGCRYAAAPTECTDTASNIGIPDKFVPALVEFCLHKALSSETDASNPAIAGAHLSAFFNLMGVDERNRIKYSPNVQSRGGNPPREARAQQ